ncbi:MULTISPECIES: hypothetical protein [unclassified Synechocystis]|uniref:hypothetical protein n=1 Tax=unclassified Synechocystis TaxID=2640012 RepID=UPI00041CF39F|nr:MULTISPECIES: hypothetical protein [unclassified Synechocystis]AIE73202.1 hypothetical protein D082_06730 [Synechocystis sp. PCC 6714]MCT0254283.1 hypothetical protein [Synechocystis sp. CS-94]
MNDHTTASLRDSEKVEVSIQLDSDLMDQIQHLTNEPNRVIEMAVKQWLRGEKERDDELTRNLRRNPPIPPRGEWND